MSDQDGSTSRREQIRQEARRRRLERGDASGSGSYSSERSTRSYTERLRQSDARQSTSRQSRISRSGSTTTHRSTSAARRNAATAEAAAGADGAARASRRSYTEQTSSWFNGKTIALAAVAVVLLVVLVGAITYCVRVSSNLHAGIDDDLRAALVETDMSKEPFYMLLLGTDSSAARNAADGEGAMYRSDSMILARIDAPNKKITLISIHRDTAVDLGEDYGVQKINAAYSVGGPAGAVEAVSKLAGVDISHYAEIDFDAFESMVDAIGGVEVTIPFDIDDPDAGGSLSAGEQTLNGEQALILCRAREAYVNVAGDPDEMRAANQRMVISAIASKLLASDVATIASTVETMSQYVHTTLELNDIIGLAQAFQGIDPSTSVYTAMQPVTSEYSNDIWWCYTDEEAWAKMMDRVKQGLPPTETNEVDEISGAVLANAGVEESSTEKYAYITVKDGSSLDGVGFEAGELLQNAGYVHVDVGPANASNYEETLVVYDDAAQAYGAQAIVDTLGQGRALKNPGDYFFEGQFLVLVGNDWVSPEA